MKKSEVAQVYKGADIGARRMKMARVLIDIDEIYYEIIKNSVKRGNDFRPYVLIAHGTVLPKEHGDLKDADALKDIAKTKLGDDITSITVLKLFEEFINNAPTVIEADKENKE